MQNTIPKEVLNINAIGIHAIHDHIPAAVKTEDSCFGGIRYIQVNPVFTGIRVYFVFDRVIPVCPSEYRKTYGRGENEGMKDIIDGLNAPVIRSLPRPETVQLVSCSYCRRRLFCGSLLN